jgi:hypothetical protein
MRKKMIGCTVLVGMCLFLTGWVVQAQEVKIRIHETAYGIDEKILTGIAHDLIDKKLADLKTQSDRVSAEIKLTAKDHTQRSIDFQINVTFQKKKTYTAEVKQIKFSLVNGRSRNVVVKDPDPIKIKRVRVKGTYEDCKTKQKVQITPEGKFNMVSIKPGKIQRKPPKSAWHFTYWQYVKGLADTPVPDYPTAKAATDNIYKLFSQVFQGSAVELLGPQSTVGNISDYLKHDSELLAWNHIGHGNESLIALSDGNLTATDVQNMIPSEGIHCAVILLNSCLTCNGSLRDAFLSKNPRTYIAGNILLPIGPSEEVDKCFWKDILQNSVRMDTALANCSKAQNLTGAFCLHGDPGLFW